MNTTATHLEVDRADAARLAFALMRFVSRAAHQMQSHTHPGQPRVGVDAFVFGPSWTPVRFPDIEEFLIALPCPALFSSTLTRGSFTLTLLDELSGERRRWAEKTLSNFVVNLDAMCEQAGLTESSRVLLEFEEEQQVFPLSAIYYWARHLAVDVGWSIQRLENEPDADACLMLLRPDLAQFPGRSNMRRRLVTLS